MSIKKFEEWSLNELSAQSTSAPIKSDGGEPSYSYGNIQDILGNKYNFSVKTEKLKEFEENVISKDKNAIKNDDYFAKRFIEFTRNKWRLTPPFQDDLIQNNDFYQRAFYDEMSAKNDIGEPIKGFQESLSDNEDDYLYIPQIKDRMGLNEDGVAAVSGGNVSGMGAVVTSQPSSIPGNTSGATTGSGDIGSGWDSSKNLNRNVISRPDGSRRKKKMRAKAKEMAKGFANQFKGGEYKQGGDKDAHIMKFTDFSK